MQNRPGWTVNPRGVEVYWNVNLTADTRRYQWANSFETGPGLRLRLHAPASPILLSIDALKGFHTVLDGSRPPSYSDIRIGLWYALTR
jgi:hypothetical protein